MLSARSVLGGVGLSLFCTRYPGGVRQTGVHKRMHDEARASKTDREDDGTGK